MSMNVVINGQSRAVPAGQTIASLVRDMDLEGQRIAIEVNKEIVPRSQYTEHALRAGDRVEVVTAIGGG